MKRTIVWFFLVVCALLVSPGAAPVKGGSPNSVSRGTPGDGWADVIIGQPGFYQITPNEVVANKTFNPNGVLVDRTVVPNRIYINDAGNSRILGLNSLGVCSSGIQAGQACTSVSDCPGSSCQINPERPADIVLGQPDFNTSACNGDSGYQNFPELPQPSRDTLCGLAALSISILEGGAPATMAVDALGNFYTTDLNNHRVLRYDSPFTTDSHADAVWGQPNFNSGSCNLGLGYGSPTATSVCLAPPPSSGAGKTGVAVDSAGNLWVADTNNNRVLRFPFNQITNLPSNTADLVLGQPNFTTALTGSELNQLDHPAAVRVDSTGAVYVIDNVTAYPVPSRILVYRPPLTNGMPASEVLIGGEGFRQATGMELDANGGLWVNNSEYEERLLHFSNGVLDRVVTGVPALLGGIGVDRDNNVMIAGWTSHGVFIYSPPDYSLTDIFLKARGFNQLGARGFTDPGGLEVAAGQLIVADNPRLLYWNDVWDLSNTYPPADGVVGQPDFYTVSQYRFGRIRADSHNRLWAIQSAFGSAATIQVYQLPLRTGTQPLFEFSSPLSLLGGGQFTWTYGVSFSGIDFQPGCNDCLWLSDPDYNRAFRIRNASSPSRYVDIVLGQTDVSGVHCNQGRDVDNGYIRPLYPSADSLCHPGGLSFDLNGNLYLADHNLEVSGNWRMLEYDHSTLPISTTTTLFAIPASRVYGRNSFTDPICHGQDSVCGPWEPAINSQGQMVIGFNGYTGSHLPWVFLDPLNDLIPSYSLKDYYSHAYSIRFDQFDNLYSLDMTRNRVLIYRDHPVTTYSIRGHIQTPSGIPLPSATVEATEYGGQSFTAVNGDYSLTGMIPGEYEIRPYQKDCTFTPPSRIVNVAGDVQNQDFIGHCLQYTFLPNVSNPYPIMIYSISPAPPACVLRNSQDLIDRLLVILGQNLPTTNHNLQFQRMDNNYLSMHFGVEVNWETTTRISVDMARISNYLWKDESRLVMKVRITDYFLKPASNWSNEFILAQDQSSCANPP